MSECFSCCDWLRRVFQTVIGTFFIQLGLLLLYGLIMVFGLIIFSVLPVAAWLFDFPRTMIYLWKDQKDATPPFTRIDKAFEMVMTNLGRAADKRVIIENMDNSALARSSHA